jgi:hypothetical protein
MSWNNKWNIVKEGSGHSLVQGAVPELLSSVSGNKLRTIRDNRSTALEIEPGTSSIGSRNTTHSFTDFDSSRISGFYVSTWRGYSKLQTHPLIRMGATK